MKLIVVLAISILSQSSWAQGVPVGTYKGSRICSDGSTPTDVVASNPIYLSVKTDGTYSSSADLFSNGGTCTELTAGLIRRSGNSLFTTTEVLDQCGQCDRPPGQRKAEQMPVRSTSNGFVVETTFTDYSEGGSCKNGQHMIVTFVKINDSYEDLSKTCQPVIGF